MATANINACCVNVGFSAFLHFIGMTFPNGVWTARLRAALTAPVQGLRRKLVIVNAFLDGKETDPELYKNQYCALKVNWPEQAVKDYIAFLKRADFRGHDDSSDGTDAAKIGGTCSSEGNGLSDGDSKQNVSLLVHQNAVTHDTQSNDSIMPGAATASNAE
jgi:hypothetical protein